MDSPPPTADRVPSDVEKAAETLAADRARRAAEANAEFQVCLQQLDAKYRVRMVPIIATVEPDAAGSVVVTPGVRLVAMA